MKMGTDWLIHFVLDGEGDIHTHGANKHNHLNLEFELHLNVDSQKGGQILNLCVDYFKQGNELVLDSPITGVFNLPFVIKKTNSISDSETPILRVIIPDPNGLFPWEEDCIEPYKSQI